MKIDGNVSVLALIKEKDLCSLITVNNEIMKSRKKTITK